jgi:hypothetical protein
MSDRHRQVLPASQASLAGLVLDVPANARFLLSVSEDPALGGRSHSDAIDQRTQI